jgi:co-chaperonin GroES (HSP10)
VKKIVILLVVLIFIAGGVAYYFGYQQGAKLGFQSGQKDGYSEGFTTGYEEGREQGYIKGYRACQAGEEGPVVEPYLLDLTKTIDTSNFIQSGLIWMWSIHFENLIITDISDYTLTLVPFDGEKMGRDELKLIVGQLTDIAKAVTVGIGEGRVTDERKEIKFGDLQLGDIVEVYARWQNINNMEPEAMITVSGHQELTGLEESDELALSIPWVAGINGEVEKISDRITLTYRNETLDIIIGDGAEADFEKIKVGDKVMISANFTEDRKLEGTKVTVLPSH